MNQSLHYLMAGSVPLPLVDNVVVDGLQSDSRRIQSGEVYFDLALSEKDCKAYVKDAIKRGATAVVVRSDFDVQVKRSVALLKVDDVEAALARAAARFYGHAGDAMKVFGVTGTNGKTTIAYLLAQLMNSLGETCGYIGTLGAGLLNDRVITGFTTPPADVLQSLLAELHLHSASAVAIEVSSHALAQKRVDHTAIRTAIFTNLTQDHLDFHSTMQAYAAAKARLFSFPGLRNAVINVDDKFGAELAESLPTSVSPFTVSFHNEQASLYCSDIVYSLEGLSACLHFNGKAYAVSCNLIGGFNLQNILLVVATALLEGYPIDLILAQVSELSPPPGRMEFVQAQNPTVVVDFAHTPQALESVCVNLRQHLPEDGRLIVVFGCGGDRDVVKRPIMGEIANTTCDLVVVTSDNPRSESAEDIIDQILQGVAVDKPLIVEPDRAVAIQKAIDKATAQDIVLIAGKGHEDYQIVGDQRIDFSDVEQAKLALARGAA